MNNKNLSIFLLVGLIMFPQLLETMYSPALTSIKNHFSVSTSEATQALSVFFIVFAFGVVFWGSMCDVIGRRISTLCGLAICIIAALSCYFAPTFQALLYSFGACAFGAAVGSVCTQTILRDSFEGKSLARIFSIAATVIGLSPVAGMLLGSWLTSYGGYSWVFAAMIILLTVLLFWCIIALPETKPTHIKRDSLLFVASKMLRDSHIWYISLMVGLANIALFSYYNIAPFMFEKLGASVTFFGNTSFVLALGSVIGSSLNMLLIRMKLKADLIVLTSILILLVSGLGVYLLQDTLWFFIPMTLVSLSFGLMLPNLLSTALVNYRNHLGTAGALLGLFYYLIIGFGLDYASKAGNLAFTLLICGGCTLILITIKMITYKSNKLENKNITAN
ncbi:MFS transporter [Photobacterium leiognathi]|uniref:MFS transporter n=1 Tax=Photobacterium leiognathi TaxID=553611 RepID=UPI002982A1CD|nr:MFS transporter [Photobacterium leiognathi]